MEDLFKAVHEAIRADPSPAPKKPFTPDSKFAKAKKLTLEQRRERVAAKKAARLQELVEQQAATGAGGDEDDE